MWVLTMEMENDDTSMKIGTSMKIYQVIFEFFCATHHLWYKNRYTNWLLKTNITELEMGSCSKWPKRLHSDKKMTYE